MNVKLTTTVCFSDALSQTQIIKIVTEVMKEEVGKVL